MATDMVEDSYVVGGVIRDCLIGLSPSNDIDLAVRGDGFAVACRIANAMATGATFVPLDRDRGTGRVVLTDSDVVTIDISSFKGMDIYEDLTRRDFTMNAVAVKVTDVLQSGISEVVDPLGGIIDIREKRIRACSKESFLDDPVRILRAFRFSSVMGFDISPATVALIPQSTGLIIDVAPERIRDEFFGVLSSGSCVPALKDMDRYGVLDAILPELSAMKGCYQNEYHHLDVWGHTLEAIRQLEWLVVHLTDIFQDTSEPVDSYLSEKSVPGRPRTALLKLVALFHDSGKPLTRTKDSSGRIHFFGHEKISRDVFLKFGKRLKLSKQENRIASRLIEGHMRAVMLTNDTVSQRSMCRLNRRFNKDIAGLLLVFLADLRASRGPARSPGEEVRAVQRAREALKCSQEMKKQRRPPLVNGHDLMRTFGITSGPYLGNLLRRLAELQECGEISSREQALEVAESIIEGTDQR